MTTLKKAPCRSEVTPKSGSINKQAEMAADMRQINIKVQQKYQEKITLIPENCNPYKTKISSNVYF